MQRLATIHAFYREATITGAEMKLAIARKMRLCLRRKKLRMNLYVHQQSEGGAFTRDLE